MKVISVFVLILYDNVSLFLTTQYTAAFRVRRWSVAPGTLPLRRTGNAADASEHALRPKAMDTALWRADREAGTFSQAGQEPL